jgi:hypothetical protein
MIKGGIIVCARRGRGDRNEIAKQSVRGKAPLKDDRAIGMPTVDRSYQVLGYHSGDFIGHCEAADRDIAVFRIIRPLDGIRRRSDRLCDFPGCSLPVYHDGEHDLKGMRPGARVEVFWRLAKFEAAS